MNLLSTHCNNFLPAIHSQDTKHAENGTGCTHYHVVNYNNLLFIYLNLY